jgi:hypothetical protein
MDSWFEELSLMRKKFVESARENNFDKGIRQSTVEKYPDPVHFVYELLQNAEDQGATEAQFALFVDCLVFRHNGNPFTRIDVENITGIGNSAKPQEANKIGRFGIGFKSVFAITDRPEIYTVLEDKPFAFAIEDLVVPIAIPENYEKSNQCDTQFIFPFIDGQKISHYAKIRKRLSALGFETLLFLRNLASITWQTETDHGVYYCEGKGSHRKLRGETNRNGQLRQKSAHYLVFTRSVSMNDNERVLDVSIAFRLDEKGKIVSEPGQKLVVFFPTEQLTGMNFRLHGPFLLTDNRANIKIDNKTNSKLIQECAALLGEGIQQIKKEDLLTIDFLSMLPIRKDDIPSLFLPLCDQTLQVLKRYRLLPTADGTFASATQIKIARGADLRELINERQLSALYGAPTPLHWLTSDITSDRTRDLYTYINKELEVEIVDPEAFVRKLEISFLKLQTDEWLVRLYTFLSKQPGLKEIIKWKPILRLKDNSHVPPFNRTSLYDRNATPNAYLLREGRSKFALVKRSLLADDAVYAFLKEIGLSEPDVVDDVLTHIIPLYVVGKFALDNEVRNRQNLKSIQEALLRTSYQKRHELISKLSKVPFIQASNIKASERAWKTPSEVYSRTKELLTWFEGNEQVWFITGSFPKTLLKDLNIPTHLQPRAKTASETTGHTMIRSEYGFNQRGLHGFDPGANLDGLQQSLELITIDKAKILWNILLKYRYLIKGVVETSKYKDFRNPRSEEKFSLMGLLCSKEAWLPNQNGDFFFPEELFLTDLPKGFEKSTDEAHELAIKLGMRKAEELLLADKLGIPHEIITLIQRNPKKILAFYQEQERKKVLLPSSLTNDPDRRREKATEAAYSATMKTYKAVSINRRISAGNSEAKIYLRNHHTNAEGQLICQLCNQAMPFSLPSGEEYFEAYQYTDVLGKEYEANHLALCPNCAAEFQYACQTDENERAKLILNLDLTVNEENLVVYIDMPVHRRLRFTQRHLIDLQAAIKDWLETDPEPTEQENKINIT